MLLVGVKHAYKTIQIMYNNCLIFAASSVPEGEADFYNVRVSRLRSLDVATVDCDTLASHIK